MSHPYTLPIPRAGKTFSRFWRIRLFVLDDAAQQPDRDAGNDAGVVVICSLAAFVFARMEFRGKNWVFNLFTLGLMFPINVAILPVYFVLRQMDHGLIIALWGVILVQTAFRLSGKHPDPARVFSAIPVELQDAAYIDGCYCL